MTQHEAAQPHSLDLIYQLASKRLDGQLREMESIDEKLRLVFGASSVIIGLLVASFPSNTAAFGIRWLVLIGPVGFYVAIIAIGISAYRFLSLQYPPNVATVYKEALFWETEITKRQILAHWVDAIYENKLTISSKIKRASFALYLILFEAITSIGAAVALHLD